MIELAATEEPGPADRAIVNISSVQALRTSPGADGLFGRLRRGRAADPHAGAGLAPHRIRVNAMAVGGVPGRSLAAALPAIEDLPEAIAEVTPLGRVGDPADFAGAALFLASPAAGFVTGQVLGVDGGRTLVDPLSVWRA